MGNFLKEEALKHGDRLQIAAAEHLTELRRDIEEVKNTEDLNGFQRWIIEEMYQFEFPETQFEVKSIIIAAAHHPFAADIRFRYSGKTYETKCLGSSGFAISKKYITEALERQGYHVQEVFNLPLKRLAVQSGLAAYGRNNITYIDGLGSNFSYLSLLTDMPCDQDEWRKACQAERCNTCTLCIKLCPTGAILPDRFLIDNQKCLSCINESGGEFPDWLPKDVHHTLYDCLRCQEKCPMNKNEVKNVIGPFDITEEETQMLLDGKGPEAFSKEFRVMADQIGLFYWPEVLPRNIRAIFDIADKNQNS